MSAPADSIKPENLFQIKRILVADDDAPTRTLLRVAISQWGYEITEAVDGNQAWEILQQDDSPQLIVIDWVMPGFDGVELCHKIRTELHRDFYIILLTQQSGPTNVCHALEAGANEFLTKPFNVSELRCRLVVGADFLSLKKQVIYQTHQLEKYTKEFSNLKSLLDQISNPAEQSNKTLDQITELTELKKNLERILDSND